MYLFGTDFLKTLRAHDVEVTSMRRRYVASTSLRRRVPAGYLPPPPCPPNILNLGPPPNILTLPTPMKLYTNEAEGSRQLKERATSVICCADSKTKQWSTVFYIKCMNPFVNQSLFGFVYFILIKGEITVCFMQIV